MFPPAAGIAVLPETPCVARNLTIEESFEKVRPDAACGLLVLGNGRVLSLTTKIIGEFLDKGG